MERGYDKGLEEGVGKRVVGRGCWEEGGVGKRVLGRGWWEEGVGKRVLGRGWCWEESVGKRVVVGRGWWEEGTYQVSFIGNIHQENIISSSDLGVKGVSINTNFNSKSTKQTFSPSDLWFEAGRILNQHLSSVLSSRMSNTVHTTALFCILNQSLSSRLYPLQLNRPLHRCFSYTAYIDNVPPFKIPSVHGMTESKQ